MSRHWSSNFAICFLYFIPRSKVLEKKHTKGVEVLKQVYPKKYIEYIKVNCKQSSCMDFPLVSLHLMQDLSAYALLWVSRNADLLISCNTDYQSFMCLQASNDTADSRISSMFKWGQRHDWDTFRKWRGGKSYFPARWGVQAASNAWKGKTAIYPHSLCKSPSHSNI